LRNKISLNLSIILEALRYTVLNLSRTTVLKFSYKTRLYNASVNILLFHI